MLFQTTVAISICWSGEIYYRFVHFENAEPN